MTTAGQVNRFAGETCWTAGGLDACEVIPEIPIVSYGGGYQASRYKYPSITKEEIENERINLGILPKKVQKAINKTVAQIIQNDEVIQENSSFEHIFVDMLHKHRIETKISYEAIFNSILRLEIKRKMQEKIARDREDADMVAILLLM